VLNGDNGSEHKRKRFSKRKNVLLGPYVNVMGRNICQQTVIGAISNNSLAD